MKIIVYTLCIFTLVFLSTSQILAIDFGTEFIKAAVVNKGSGKAFSIVQTPKSQRKFLNSIGFYSQQRFYEAESIPKRTRWPQNCFIFTRLLVDSVLNPELKSIIKKDLLLQYIKQDLEDPLLAQFTLQHFPAQSSKVTLIQVMAMIIKYAKVNAQKQIKQQLKDAVMTIPSSWNVKMRAFLIQAAQIADLHILSLITQNSAAAINYALNQRHVNTTQTILFYNLGSNALEMTLTQFKQVPQQKSVKPVQSIFIIDDYSKIYVGGLKFDVLLHKYFIKKFQQKHKKQLSQRGSLKLWGEVSQVKQVLSANREAPIFVQGIMDSLDYHDKVTRTQFEQMIMPTLKQITAPIKRFLFDNNMRPEDLDAVEIIGGSSRIPKLQSMIAEIIGNASKVGTHINADQAMVLGAAFYGANSSKKFKVKGVNLYDGFNFDIRAVIRNLQEGIQQSDDRYIHKNVTVFTKKSRFGLTKQLNFKCKQNIVIELYKEDQTGLELLRSDKLDNIKDVNQTDFKVSITLAIDALQVVVIKKADIKYKKDQIVSYMQKVKKAKPAGEDKKQDQQKPKQQQEQVKANKQQEKQHQVQQTEQEKQQTEETQHKQQVKTEQDQQAKQKEQQPEKEQEKQNQQKGQTDQQKTEETKQKADKKKQQKKKKKKQPKQQYQTVERNKTVTKKYQRDLRILQIYSRQKADQQTIQKSRKMLKQYENAEDQRKRLAESKNKLEALIYEIKEKVQAEQFLQYTKKDEVQKLKQLVAQKAQWLDQTSSTNKHDYDDQSKGLLKPLDKIKKRIHEYQSREVHYKRAIHSIKQYRQLSMNITKKKQWITAEEVEDLVDKIDGFKKEIQQIYQSMQDTPQNQTCLVTIKDMEKIVQKAKQQYFKVMAIPKPKQKKKEQKVQKQQKSADQSEQL